MYFSIVKDGKKTSTITLLKIMEMPSYLELQKQRFYCKSCDISIILSKVIVEVFLPSFTIEKFSFLVEQFSLCVG
jgi:LytS/YehU family sensor histidine kinase